MAKHRPIRIPVTELIHTEETPFCADPTCPCHGDAELCEDYLLKPFREGRLTLGQMTKRLQGKKIKRTSEAMLFAVVVGLLLTVAFVSILFTAMVVGH